MRGKSGETVALRCLLCTGHTPWDVLNCSSIWCGGSRDHSREATAAEVDEASRRIMANSAARSSGLARVGGRGGGGGGGGQRVRQANYGPVSSFGQPPESGGGHTPPPASGLHPTAN